MKYSRALEEQGKASTRERELLRQVGRSAAGGGGVSPVYLFVCDCLIFKKDSEKTTGKIKTRLGGRTWDEIRWVRDQGADPGMLFDFL